MKKFTDFLEKNCQWLAIGAGALFLVFMVYTYVLTNTTFSVSVDGKEVPPGQVDDYVKKTYAEPLDAKMKSSTPPKIPVPSFDYVTDLTPKATAEYALVWTNNLTKDPPVPNALPTTPVPNPANPNAPLAPALAGNFVIELPKPPAPTDLGTINGRSSANVPTPIPVIPVADPNNPQPQPAPVQQVASASDVNWVTVNYSINLKDLAKAFVDSKIPAVDQFKTCVLDVELVRQEMDANGNWGPETICPKLTTSTQPPFPASKVARLQYLTWATSATLELLQPKFYDVIKGDQWTLSKDLVGEGVVQPNGGIVVKLEPNQTREGFDPNTYAEMDDKALKTALAALVPPATRQEKYLIAGAREKKRQEKARANRPAPTPRAPGGGGGGAGRRGGAAGDYAPDDGYRPGARPSGRPSMEGDIMGEPGIASPGAANQPSNFSSMFPIQTQNQEFDPRTLVAAPPPGTAAVPTTWVCWAHDWKAEPGKTYRYMVRYKIKNPVWNTGKVTKPQELANEFALISGNSEWTKPVVVPGVTNFFFAQQGGIGNQRATKVEVFRFQDGALHKSTFNVFPGDIIGIGADKDGIDYSTGYTLVDVRADAKDRAVAWLLTPEGQLIKRDIKTDAESPQKMEFEKQITPPTASAASGAGAP